MDVVILIKQESKIRGGIVADIETNRDYDVTRNEKDGSYNFIK